MTPGRGELDRGKYLAKIWPRNANLRESLLVGSTHILKTSKSNVD
jgi:hypothetical protein